MSNKLFFTLLFLALFHAVFSQVTTFDIFKFTKPAGYTKQDRKGALAYTTSNNARGIYSIIVLYANENSNGSPEKDFTAFWDRVVKPLSPASAPQMENGQAIKGWKNVRGFSTFSQSGAVSLVALQTYTCKEKTAALLYLFNDTAYRQQLDLFETNLTLQPYKANNTIQNSSAESGPFNTTVIHAMPKGWNPVQSANGITCYASPLLECTENSYYNLYVLKPTNYNGSLREYAYALHKKNFFQPYNQYQVYQEGDKRIVKGIDEQGREFLSFETGAHGFGDNTWHYGLVYLLRKGDEMAAFILEQKPTDRNKYAPPTSLHNFIDECPLLKSEWKKFLTSVQFANAAPVKNNVPDELTGSWTSRVHLGWSTIAGSYSVENTQVLEKYSFNEDGSYTKDEFAKGKSGGHFSVSGNKITVTDDKGKIFTYRFKLESIFEYGRWHRSLSFFSNDEKEIKLSFEANE
jgi:hypothetical protein